MIDDTFYELVSVDDFLSFARFFSWIPPDNICLFPLGTRDPLGHQCSEHPSQDHPPTFDNL